MKYKIVRRLPVAAFFYKGSHSHPVRRLVLVIENNKKYIKGYEIREGHVVRNLEESPVKTFTRKKIATTAKLRKDNKLRNNDNVSTLNRLSIKEL